MELMAPSPSVAAQSVPVCPRAAQCAMPPIHGEPSFSPQEAVEGDPRSPIWIVSLNPKTGLPAPGGPNPMTWGEPDPSARYFRQVRSAVGADWAPALLREGGLAHTDVVKCGSPSFDDTARLAVGTCSVFLIEQLRRYTPRVLLVLSSPAAAIVAGAAGFPKDATEGIWDLGGGDGAECNVVLGGYAAPMQDRYSRLRLRRDFVAACERAGLNPPPVLGLSGPQPD
jgi:hypothetical protein